MKTVAYSEVPRTPGYVHLAYLSASSAKLVSDSILETGVFMAAFSVLVFVIGSKFKLPAKSPRLWRLIAITLVTATLLTLMVGYLATPAPTRGKAEAYESPR